MIFRGTFEHALDAKHRLTVPAKFRADLARGVVLAASPEVGAGSPRSVSIWLPDTYQQFTAQAVTGLNPLSARARELNRFFYSSSFDVELDSAHRLMIQPPLMRYANLQKDVIVIGSGDCIEIFDRTAYEGYREDFLTRIPDLAASLGDTA